MIRFSKLRQNGDTIIEVVLSMSLLTSILFTAWSITNRSSQILSAARERTLMVNQVKEQAEIIKNQWEKNPPFLTNPALPSISNIQPNPCQNRSGGSYPIGAGEAHIKVDQATRQLSIEGGVKKVNDDENKDLWIQKIDRAGTAPDPGAIDFYVRACWLNNSGANQKLENTQVLVRLSK